MGFRSSIILFLLATAPLAMAKRTYPDLATQGLSPKSYVSVKTYPYKDAKLLYVNDEYLKELGYEVPPRDSPFRAEFEAKLLEEHARGVPKKGQKQYFNLKNKKTFYSDRYGGTRIGNNFGSGRAMTNGRYQYKGGVQSPLVGWSMGDSHSSGELHPNEAFRDVTFGEIFHTQTPYGGNRVALVFSTGIPMADGTIGVSAMRLEKLRPAHYISARYGLGWPKLTEKSRVKAAVKNIVQALPQPVGSIAGLSERQLIERGLEEYATRLGTQYGTAIAKKLFHGATSPSNFLIDGEFIDFATATTLPDHGPAQVLAHVEAFGSTKEIKQTLLDEFTESLKKYHSLKLDLPSYKLSIPFQSAFEHTLSKEVLQLAGVPANFSEALMAKSQVWRFAETLWQIAREPQFEAVDINKVVPDKIGQNNFEEVCHLIWKQEVTDAELAHAIPFRSYRETFQKQRIQFLTEAKAFALEHGYSMDELTQFAHRAITIRNRPIPELYRQEMEKSYREYEALYGKNPNREAYERMIATKLKTIEPLQSLSLDRGMSLPTCATSFREVMSLMAGH